MEHSRAYLGDGVFVAIEDRQIKLTVEDGIRVTNTILLEPEVVGELLNYIDRLRESVRAKNAIAVKEG